MVIGETEDIMRSCFIRYLQKQRKGFMLDFDDLILFTVYLFRDTWMSYKMAASAGLHHG